MEQFDPSTIRARVLIADDHWPRGRLISSLSGIYILAALSLFVGLAISQLSLAAQADYEYKLDWFFVKGLATDSRKPGGKYQFAPHFAWTLMELNNAPQEPLSDHAPITVDFPLSEPPPRTTSP